jgi:hypothetical protein
MSDMAKLIVSTLPARNSVAAFVASAEGVPAVGLGPSNFKVQSTVPGSDGAPLRIAEVVPTMLGGFYVVELAMVGPAARRKGLYVFDLIVEKGEDRGRALSSAIIS